MTEDTTNLVLEHLRAICSENSAIREDIREVKARLGDVEHGVAHLHAVAARHSSQFDRVQERLERIERRLELVDS